MNADLNWDDLQLLGAMARAGTLSAAARTLGVDQTTAARRLARIEARMGEPLFDRINGRHVPTPLLNEALAPLAAMADAARLSEAALHRSRAEMRGTVRISSVGLIISDMLAPAIGSFTAEHPAVVLELMVEDQSVSFARREADISLRLGRGPDDLASIRKLGTLPFHLYRPSAGATAGRIVTYDDSLSATPEMQLLARLRPDAAVVARSNRLDVLIAAALATGAEVMLPDFIGQADPRFTATAADTSSREVFRLSHPDRARLAAVEAAIAWVDATITAALRPPSSPP
ncbi:LysR family transcriptional regulator [Oryzibacter oryziterrae]|uniref:LysR family transcriptional regulator n=1 Tax=Oryzibacter oryziterrae TaxID=2766474 RepID=UPI001F3253F4|nr:LysR family transcriptional regulator [Oryzibacter oryziterrae]